MFTVADGDGEEASGGTAGSDFECHRRASDEDEGLGDGVPVVSHWAVLAVYWERPQPLLVFVVW